MRQLDFWKDANTIQPRLPSQIRIINMCWTLCRQEKDVSELQSAAKGINDGLVDRSLLVLVLQQAQSILDSLPNMVRGNIGEQRPVVGICDKIFFLIVRISSCAPQSCPLPYPLTHLVRVL